RARNLLAEFGRELAEHGRAMHAHLLEHAAAHHRHDATAAGTAGMILALPGCALEAARSAVGEGGARGQRILQRFERRADVVAQPFEPGAGARFAFVDRIQASLRALIRIRRGGRHQASYFVAWTRYAIRSARALVSDSPENGILLPRN